MKGVSLIETILVIAIIGFLSTIGVNIFINFKNDTEIDNVTSELLSDIKLARNKSMNGELLNGETEDSFDENGLPEYGVSIVSNGYKIVRQCLKEDGVATCNNEDLSEYDDFKSRDINSKYILEPEMEFYFERITGKTDPITINIKEKGGDYGRIINISSDFLITISKE